MSKNEAPGTAKKGFFRIVFSRTGIILLLILLQAGVFLGMAFYLEEYMTYIYGILTILGVIVLIYIINSEGNPAFKMTWMLCVLAFPVIGTLFYIYVKMQFGTRFMKDRLGKLKLETAPYMQQDQDVVDAIWASKSANAQLSYYLSHQLGFPTYRNTQVKYFPLGEYKFQSMVEELKKARRFIFMEYFIVEEGHMWGAILDILKEKVREGVEVRFMYDGMCAISMLPYNYPEQIARYGIKCKMANSVKPFLSTTQNNRDHRKICVIDGKVGYTGGINLGDEYINQKVRFGHWKDTEDVGEEVYFHILNHAKKYVHIMTPYLILDNEMITTLTRVAKSGIEVIIIMPHIPDKWYAFAVAKTYYKELIEGGVQIYEYTPGFVHAKVFVSDDDTATVGTINLDYRSLYLHFECGAFIYNNSEVDKIERDFQQTLARCHKVTLIEVKNRSMLTKIAGQVMRLVAPLM